MIWNIINVSQTQRDHTQDDISATTLRLILEKNYGNLNLEKNIYLKKYKNKCQMFSIWSKFCLNQEATTH